MVDEESVKKEAEAVASKKGPTKIQEIPPEISWDDKLFEIKRAVQNTDAREALARIERKMDFLYEFVKKRLGG